MSDEIELPPEITEAARKSRAVLKAYADVFGLPDELGGKRTDAQKLVWADIEAFCKAYQLCVELRTDGSLAERNHVLNEGRRSVWLRIRGALIQSLKPAPKAPTITRAKK